MGTHDLATNTVNLQDGARADAAAAGTKANFIAAGSVTALAGFNATFPNRAAFKHAHSQQNPEKDWGSDTLNAVRFAFYVLNEQFAPKGADGSTTVRFKADNTIVIASSVSNGGASAIAAAEQDTEGLIDGIAVSEPVLEQAANPALIVRQGSKTQWPAAARRCSTTTRSPTCTSPAPRCRRGPQDRRAFPPSCRMPRSRRTAAPR